MRKFIEKFYIYLIVVLLIFPERLYSEGVPFIDYGNVFIEKEICNISGGYSNKNRHSFFLGEYLFSLNERFYPGYVSVVSDIGIVLILESRKERYMMLSFFKESDIHFNEVKEFIKKIHEGNQSNINPIPYHFLQEGNNTVYINDEFKKLIYFESDGEIYGRASHAILPIENGSNFFEVLIDPGIPCYEFVVEHIGRYKEDAAGNQRSWENYAAKSVYKFMTQGVVDKEMFSKAGFEVLGSRSSNNGKSTNGISPD